MNRFMCVLVFFGFSSLAAQDSLRTEFDQAAFEFLQKTELFDFYPWESVAFEVENNEQAQEQKCESLKPAEVLPWP